MSYLSCFVALIALNNLVKARAHELYILRSVALIALNNLVKARAHELYILRSVALIALNNLVKLKAHAHELSILPCRFPRQQAQRHAKKTG